MALTLADVKPIENTFKITKQATPDGYKAPAAYTPTGLDTVQGQMTGLLSQNSDYMQSARKSGERMADSRGLLNSGLSSQYSQKAAIDSSLPIAQQDADSRVQSKMQQQEGAIQGALGQQKYGYDLGLLNQGSLNTAGLSTLENQQRSSLSAQESNQGRMAAEDTFGYESKLSKQQSEQERLAAGDTFGYESKLSAQEAGQTTERDKALFGYESKLSTQESDQLRAKEKDLYGYESSLSGQAFTQDLTKDQGLYAFQKEFEIIKNDNSIDQIQESARLQLLHDETLEDLSSNNTQTRDKKLANYALVHDKMMAKINTDNTLTVEDRLALHKENLSTLIGSIDKDKVLSLADKEGAIQKANQEALAYINGDINLDYAKQADARKVINDAEILRLESSLDIGAYEKNRKVDAIYEEEVRTIQSNLDMTAFAKQAYVSNIYDERILKLQNDNTLEQKQKDEDTAVLLQGKELEQAKTEAQFNRDHEKLIQDINNKFGMDSIEAKGAIEKAMQDKDLTADESKYRFAATHDKDIQKINNDNTLSQMDKQEQIDFKKMQFAAAETYRLQDLENASKEKIAAWGLDNDATKALTSQATVLSTTLMESLSRMEENKDLSVEAKTELANRYKQNYQVAIENMGLLWGKPIEFEEPGIMAG
jgi:hypothetical protein